MHELVIGIPRHGAGPREVARGSEIWRLFQEIAVQASAAVGWPPERYRETGTSFVVYGMTVQHHREVPYGQALQARTWVHDFRRATLTKRQIRLSLPDGTPVASCTQQWVHTDASLRPCRAPQALLDALPVEHPDEPSIELPELDLLDPPVPVFAFSFTVWHVWMDPLAHVNHPQYVDFADESLARALHAAGADPQGIVPVAEHVTFKRGADAPRQVTVTTTCVGRAGDAWAFAHELLDDDGQVCARVTTLRRHVAGDLAALLGLGL